METEKLSVIQKRNALNDVFRVGAKGPGGAYHEYAVTPAEGGAAELLRVCFQKGPRNEEGSVRGVTDEDLLEIVRDRLAVFQAGALPTRENALALTYIEEALLWLYKRKEDRAERQVLGTYQK